MISRCTHPYQEGSYAPLSSWYRHCPHRGSRRGRLSLNRLDTHTTSIPCLRHDISELYPQPDPVSRSDQCRRRRKGLPHRLHQ